MKRIALLAVLAALAVAAAGCGGGDGDSGNGAAAGAGTGAVTPEPIRNEVWERSYSECSSYDLQRLSSKYRVAAREDDIASAVAANWTERFKGGEDAIRAGRDGCLKGFDTE